MKNKRLISKQFFIISLCIISIIFICIVKFCLFAQNPPITNIQEYENILCSIKNQDEISHFPKSIPSDAEDVELYYWTSSTNGSLLLLQFKIDKEYIQNELKRLSFINYYHPVGCRQNIYHFPQKKGFIASSNLTFYVLKNKDNESIFKDYFPYFTGIGVDKNLEHIIYYYIEPDD